MIGEVGDVAIFPRFGRGRHENSPSRGHIDHSAGKMSSIRGKLANHVGDHVVLSLEGIALINSPGIESSYPRLPQSLND